MKGNPGVNNLARTLHARMVEVSSQPPTMELGKILPDMSLLTDRFPVPIPAGDYLVCRTLTMPNPLMNINTGTASVGDHGAHSHSVSISCPPKLAPLAGGDRVLVAWVNNDTEPVVLDIVTMIDVESV